MRKIAILVIASWMAISRASACDVCGCSAPGNSLGILPQYQKHFVGLTYQYQSFHSTHPIVTGEATPAISDDIFQSATLWGRFYPAKRLQLFAFLPYHHNLVKESNGSTAIAGIGDARLLANYMLLNNTDTGATAIKHTLLAGGGIKAPTGKNDHTNSEGTILSNMQPGSGSWDFLVNANYTIRYKKTGLNADISYQVNTTNKRDYLYGNKFNAGLTAFAWLENRSFTFLPQAGLRLQYSEMDLSSRKYRIHNTYSGGYQLYGSCGLAIYHRAIALSGVFSIPVKEHYAGGLVKSNPRYEMQVQYLF